MAPSFDSTTNILTFTSSTPITSVILSTVIGGQTCYTNEYSVSGNTLDISIVFFNHPTLGPSLIVDYPGNYTISYSDGINPVYTETVNITGTNSIFITQPKYTNSTNIIDWEVSVGITGFDLYELNSSNQIENSIQIRKNINQTSINISNIQLMGEVANPFILNSINPGTKTYYMAILADNGNYYPSQFFECSDNETVPKATIEMTNTTNLIKITPGSTFGNVTQIDLYKVDVNDIDQRYISYSAAGVTYSPSNSQSSQYSVNVYGLTLHPEPDVGGANKNVEGATGIYYVGMKHESTTGSTFFITDFINIACTEPKIYDIFQPYDYDLLNHPLTFGYSGNPLTKLEVTDLNGDPVTQQLTNFFRSTIFITANNNSYSILPKYLLDSEGITLIDGSYNLTCYSNDKETITTKPFVLFTKVWDIDPQYNADTNIITWTFTIHFDIEYIQLYSVTDNTLHTGNITTFTYLQDGTYNLDLSSILLNNGTKIIDNPMSYEMHIYINNNYKLTNFNTKLVEITAPVVDPDFIGFPIYYPPTSALTFNFTTNNITSITLTKDGNNIGPFTVPQPDENENGYTYTVTLSPTPSPGSYGLKVTGGSFGEIIYDSTFNIYIATDLSVQWGTVLQDNIRLMKSGLYNESVDDYHYVYEIEPTDLSSYTDTTKTSVPLLSTGDNTLYFNNTFTGVSLNNGNSIPYIGINNSICNFQIGGPEDSDYYIRTDSNFITIEGGAGFYNEFTRNYSIKNNAGTITVVNNEYVAEYTIFDIQGAKYTAYSPGYDLLDIVISNKRPNFVEGQQPQSLYVGKETGAAKILVNYTGTDYTSSWIPNTVDNAYSVVGDALINPQKSQADSTLPKYPSTYYVIRIQAGTLLEDDISDIKSLLTNGSLKLQWGYDSKTKPLFYGITYKTGNCKLFINIPTTSVTGFESKLYGINKSNISAGETSLECSFIISSDCTFEQTYIRPTKSLSEIRYTDLGSSINQLTNYYIPSMVPAGDYKIVNNNSEPKLYFMPGSELKMSADRCRQPWRLSHYVRANYPPIPNISNTDVNKIAYNTAAALVYNASLDTVQPGRVTLNVNMCNLTNSYDGYSGDMVPPLLALIDALTIHEYTALEGPIKNYSKDVKELNKGLTGYVAASDENKLTFLIDQLNAKSSNVYPVLDSITSGGQQLGLVGCGLVCTHDFLARNNFDVMLKYDSITGWNSYNSSKYNGFKDLSVLENPTNKVFNNTEFDNLIHIYKMLAMRGNGFELYDYWAHGSTGYDASILSNAYVTNLRIRDINIDIVNELKFGPDLQSDSGPELKISVNSYANHSFEAGCNSPYIPTYVYTDFPMYGIPDSGWGSLTVEIFSYLGVVFAGMNDYKNFCKWHRALWHMLFIQNGGDMYGWAADGSIKKQNSNRNILAENMWLPSYVEGVNSQTDADPPGTPNQIWLPKVINVNQIHYFSIYKWPLDNYYDNIRGNEGGTNTKSTTRVWANRQCPYRGDDDSGLKYRWSTPSYCMGYSPAWVAAGKTTRTSDWTDNGINRPIAEALNPIFLSSLGLYSATDGDENILQAYLLAGLQWTNSPTLNTTDGLNSSHTDPDPPTSSSPNSNNYGYDCDIADFFRNNDMPSGDTTPSGVKYATLHRGPETNVNITECNKTTNQDVVVTKTFYVTDKIGYGITYDGSVWKFPMDGDKRCTTWAYIAESIQKSMISKNGCGFSNDFGNFAPLALVPSSGDTGGSRFETLGRDTNASDSSTKLDYIDSRLYQICQTLTTPS